MQETPRLKDLHEVMNRIILENMSADGQIKRCQKLDNLISIYRDIADIDSKDINEDEQVQISKILHHAYVINGGFDWEKTGPDTYSVYFMGGFESEYKKRKCIRIDLRVGNGFARFIGYQILQTNNY